MREEISLIDTYLHEGPPRVLTGVFNQTDCDHNYLMFKTDGRYAFFMMGEYHPAGNNEHLGTRVVQRHLGHVAIDRVIPRLGC